MDLQGNGIFFFFSLHTKRVSVLYFTVNLIVFRYSQCLGGSLFFPDNLNVEEGHYFFQIGSMSRRVTIFFSNNLNNV